MNGKDGKPFKTREGGVMRLEKLISDIDEAVFNRIMENRTVSEEEARETAKVVGLAALKYGDLSNQASKDYIFDMDRFISFEGNTGPYILYTIVRIKSILGKYKENGGSVSELAAEKRSFRQQELLKRPLCFSWQNTARYWKTALQKQLRTRSASMSMRLLMHLTVFTTIPRSSLRKMRPERTATSA